MIRSIKINADDVLQIQARSCIPLATTGCKLLTVTSNSIYNVSIDGKHIFQGKNLLDAIEVYNNGVFSPFTKQRYKLLKAKCNGLPHYLDTISG